MSEDAAAGAARPSRPVVLGATAEGASGYAASAENAGPRARPRMPRVPHIPRRTLLASATALLLLVGPAVGTIAIVTAPPTALDVFDADPTAADESVLAELESWGYRMAGEARVIAPEREGFTLVGMRAPEGTVEAFRASGGFPAYTPPTPTQSAGGTGSSDPGSPLAYTEICLFLVQTTKNGRIQCTTDEQFARHGLAVSLPDQTAESVAYWGPDGSTSLEHVAYGPTTLAALRALEIPAIEFIDRPAGDDDDARSADTGSLFFGEQVLPPQHIARDGEWQMSASVMRPSPFSGLAVCVMVFRTEAPIAESTGGCVDVPTFVSQANSGTIGLSSGVVEYSWAATGEASLSVVEQ